MSHSPLCLYKRRVLSDRLKRTITAAIVHEICEILIENGMASSAEEVVRWCETAPISEVEAIYKLAEERRKKKRRMWEEPHRELAYSYIG
jgi:DNA polymerase elongation subunit (family B)